MSYLSELESSEPAPLRRYRNQWRWRVMVSKTATAEGYHERCFGSKARALAYEKQVKGLFPGEFCAVCDTGRYYDMFGRIYETKDGR